MNKIFLSLTTALLAVGTTFSAIDAEFVRKAISKHNVDAVKACVMSGTAFPEDVKNEFVKLSQTEVECLESSVLQKIEPIELISTGITLVALGALARCSYEEWYDEKDQAGRFSKWKTGALFVLGLTKLGDTAVKLYKDICGNCKKGGTLKNAQEILELVGKLPIR